jgi:hypothetical protein
MPRYLITTRIIDEWEGTFDAPDEQAARDLAYREVEQDIPPGGYVEHTVVLLQE